MKMYKGIRGLAVLMTAVLGGSFAQGADGTWTNVAGGTWSTGGNWSGGTVADGSGFTANFNTIDITAATTVNLDTARTMGTLIFGDTATATAGTWVLANNSTPANILTLGGAATITVNTMASGSAVSASNVTISAVITGTSGLIKNGSGANSFNTGSVNGTSTLTLSGANTYTGGTDIQTGAIRAANALAFGGAAGGTVTVENGAALVLSGVNIANAIVLKGGNALAATTGSTSTLSGTVTLTSNSTALVTNVGGGNPTLTFSGTLALGSSVLSLQTAGSGNTATISGTLTGGATSGITVSGGGPLTISGDGSGYSGTTSVNSATLILGSDTALGTGTLALTPGNNNTASVRSSGAIGSTRTSAAAVTFDNSSFPTYSFGSATTGNLTFTNTTAIALGSIKTIQVVNSQTEFDAAFTGVGGITTKVTTSTGTLLLNGANTYTGATTINGGTLQLGNGGTTGSLSTSSTITNNANFAIKRSNAVAQGTDFSGSAISGTGSFTQAGSGTTTLTAANSYTGATNVNAGTLLVNGSLSASSAVAVNSGGTLGGTNGTVGTVTVASGGSLAPGSGNIGIFNTIAVTEQAGSILKLELNTGTSSADLLNVSGLFTLAATNDSILQLSLLGTDVVTGSSFTLVDYGTWNGGLFTYLGSQLADDALITLGLNQYQFSYNGTDGLTSAITLTAVPEPSTYALLLTGGVALYALRRKKAGQI